MTEQEQYLACAELDGIKDNGERDGYYRYSDGAGRNFSHESEFDYSTRDAVIGVIEKQPQKIQLSIIKLLDTNCIDGWYDWQVLKALLATPSQLREALLRATVKWNAIP